MKNGWRLPTTAEYEDLINNCTWEWTKVKGVAGYKVTDPNTKLSIFFPATGNMFEGRTYSAGIGACCWTGDLSDNTDPEDNLHKDANRMHFNNVTPEGVEPGRRFYGRPIRPVREIK